MRARRRRDGAAGTVRAYRGPLVVFEPRECGRRELLRPSLLTVEVGGEWVDLEIAVRAGHVRAERGRLVVRKPGSNGVPRGVLMLPARAGPSR